MNETAHKIGHLCECVNIMIFLHNFNSTLIGLRISYNGQDTKVWKCIIYLLQMEPRSLSQSFPLPFPPSGPLYPKVSAPLRRRKWTAMKYQQLDSIADVSTNRETREMHFETTNSNTAPSVLE